VEVIVDCDGSSTIFSSQIEWTLAVEVIGQINAFSNGRTGSIGTVVNVDLTVPAFISIRADTLVALAIVNTGGSILAGSFSAGIILILTTNTREVSRTRAVEGKSKVLTGSSIHAGVSNASLGRGLTLLTISSRGTGTEEVLEEVHTKSIVLTSGLTAALLILLTVLANPALRTSTFIVSNQVLTFSTISAG